MPVWQARVRMPVSYTRQQRRCPASLRADPPRLQAPPCESSTCLGLMPSTFLRPGYVVRGTLPYVVAKLDHFFTDFYVLYMHIEKLDSSSLPTGRRGKEYRCCTMANHPLGEQGQLRASGTAKGRGGQLRVSVLNPALRQPGVNRAAMWSAKT